MVIWVTSSCNLLVSSGHARAQYHKCHFHLTMEYCCVHPALWIGGLDHTQFMLGIQGARWPVVKHLVFTKPQ